MSESQPDFPVQSLKRGFQFSQSALQDFSDCRRRFQLRYLLHFTWPALESEPALENERFIQRGDFFHRLAHQYLAGVSADRLGSMIQEDLLSGWWENFQRFTSLAGLDSCAALHPEIGLTAPLGEYRLAAKYDLIAMPGDGRFIIYDWKTSQRQQEREWLAGRLQTRLYPYLLVRAGSGLNRGRSVEPEEVEMIYWFASFPDEPVRFPYSLSRFDEDQAFITQMIAEIVALPPEQFYLTTQEKRCAYCIYRSLCGRGEQAGRFGDKDESYETDGPTASLIDFEQIAEIEF